MALVVLLRGVNVGGHRTFRPAALAEQLKHLGAVNIGAAGTFVIRRPVSEVELCAELGRRLPFDTEIMICPGREILQLMSRDFFSSHTARPDIIRFVSVLARAPGATPSSMSFPATGEWLVRILALEGRYVVGLHRRHMKAIAHLGKLDRIFGTPVTTRNWNTLAAIASVLEKRMGIDRALQ